jgi:hypothetical protein
VLHAEKGTQKKGTGIFSKPAASSPREKGDRHLFQARSIITTKSPRAPRRKSKGENPVPFFSFSSAGTPAKPATSSPQNLPVLHEENQRGTILSLFSLFPPRGRSLNVSAETLNSFVPRAILKGLNHSAQGWRSSAYPG